MMMATATEEPPSAQKIIDIKNDGSLLLNVECLEQILLNENIKDKKVCIVSIVGPYRQGKSFLLNFLIRYLKFICEESRGLTSEDGPITGFTSKGGCKTVTNGVLIWPEIFLTKLSSNEEVAVVLMDTQGLFDNQQPLNSNAFIFTISTLVSSVQIYNLKSNINSLNLEVLQYFLEYGKLFNTPGSEKPFQNFLILIRDWRSLKDYPYGEWGNLYMDEVLDTDIKDNLNNLFNNIECFLLPHPGLKVDSDDFNGDLEDITEDFIVYVEIFILALLSPDNLVPKLINGQEITVKHLVELFKHYGQMFNSQEIPKVESIFAATATVQHLAASKEAEDLYDDLMKSFEDPDFTDETELQNEHERCIDAAVQHFIGKKIIGDKTKIDNTLANLTNKLEEKYEKFAAAKRQRMIQQELEKKNLELLASEEKEAKTQQELRDVKSENSHLKDEIRLENRRAIDRSWSCVLL